VTNNLLIGLAGPAGCGKDSAATFLQQSFGFEVLSFSEAWLRLREVDVAYVSSRCGVVVDFVSFDSEAVWFRQRGGVVVHVSRDSVGGCSRVGFAAGDVRLANNGDLNEFYKKIDDMALAMIVEAA